MTSLSYGRIFCLESQNINGTYQRYNHYLNLFYLNFTFLLEISLQFTQNLNRNLKKEQRYGVKQHVLFEEVVMPYRLRRLSMGRYSYVFGRRPKA